MTNSKRNFLPAHVVRMQLKLSFPNKTFHTQDFFIRIYRMRLKTLRFFK